MRHAGELIQPWTLAIAKRLTLRDTSTEFRSWVPAVAGMAVVIGLHLWRRSSV